MEWQEFNQKPIGKRSKVHFENSQGIKLSGLLEEFESNKKEICLMIHGYSSSKYSATWSTLSMRLAKKKFSSFRFDLDGCGESEGNFAEQTVSSMIDDADSAIKYLKEQGYQNIHIVGGSAGGITAMGVALKHPDIKRMVLRAPVSDFAQQITDYYGDEEIVRWKERGYRIYEGANGKKKVNYAFYPDTKKHVMYSKVQLIQTPTLIIHGNEDEIVPVEQSKKLIKKFSAAKLLLLKGANHILEVDGDFSLAHDLTIDWILKGKAAQSNIANYYR